MLKPSQVGLISAMCLFSTFALAKGERYGGSVNMLTIESIDYDEGSSGDVDTLRYGLVHTRPIDETTIAGVGGWVLITLLKMSTHLQMVFIKKLQTTSFALFHNTP